MTIIDELCKAVDEYIRYRTDWKFEQLVKARQKFSALKKDIPNEFPTNCRTTSNTVCLDRKRGCEGCGETRAG